MSKLKISPSRIGKFDIKIVKDGIYRSANEILTKDVKMAKIREICQKYFFQTNDEALEIKVTMRVI